MPTALEWYMKKLFKLERNLARIVRPIANKVTSVPIPGDLYFQSIQNLYKKLRGIEEIMKSYHTTSVRLITNPEKIVMKETQRTREAQRTRETQRTREAQRTRVTQRTRDARLRLI